MPVRSSPLTPDKSATADSMLAVTSEATAMRLFAVGKNSEVGAAGRMKVGGGMRGVDGGVTAGGWIAKS